MELNIHTCSSIKSVRQVVNMKHIILFFFLQGKLSFLSCFPSFPSSFLLFRDNYDKLQAWHFSMLSLMYILFCHYFFNHILFWEKIEDNFLIEDLFLWHKYHLSHMIHLKPSLNLSHPWIFRNNNLWNINQGPFV